jgi:hypothetical protein
MIEGVVDSDKHLAGDCDEGSIVSSTFHYSLIELAEPWVVTCGVLDGFDEYPADVAVSVLCDQPACGDVVVRDDGRHLTYSSAKTSFESKPRPIQKTGLPRGSWRRQDSARKV